MKTALLIVLSVMLGILIIGGVFMLFSVVAFKVCDDCWLGSKAKAAHRWLIGS